MNRMGIIGSGPIGSAIARLAVAAGYEALLSNSRGPESLTELIDELESTTAEYEQSLLPGSVIVKVFNNIIFHHIPALAHSTPRTALPVAGDDAEAKASVSQIVTALGFDPVDAGTLAESWRFEPESGAYTSIYAADSSAFAKNYLDAPGAPLPAHRLGELLASSQRPDVAARQF